MKKVFTCTAIAIIILAVFNGCKKSHGPNYFMSATVGGTAYHAPKCVLSLIQHPGTGLAGTGLVITGSSSSNYFTTAFPYIAITLPSWASGIGTFTLDSTMLANFAQYFTTDSTYKLSSAGSVVITTASSTL